MEVTAAQLSDERDIAEVHVRTWQAAYRGHVPDEHLESLSVERHTEAWRAIITESALPAKGAFVLEHDGRVMGFAHVFPSRDDDAAREVGEITSICVMPDLWGRGAGGMLLDRALESLRAAGCSSATLWVLDTNARARRFYEAQGWLPEGATKVDDRGSFLMREIRYRRAIAR